MQKKQSTTAYSQLYKNTLLNNVIPFWETHSIDHDNGGFFSCLDRKGQVYDTDKFVWLQCRQVWTFAMLYNQVEKKEQWLEIALHGARFLEENGRDESGNWFFSLDKKGEPLIQPYNIFSDCFAAMAFGAIFKATGEERFAKIATTTYSNIIRRQENPKGIYNKHYPATRPLKNFALPMILCNLSLELEGLVADQLINQTMSECIDMVMKDFYKPIFGLVVENVQLNGAFSDSFDGRLLNPGHAIEAMWFIMDLAIRNGDQALVQKAVDITLHTLEYSWDKDYGGIYYFMDVKGHPPQQLEWNQKLWWVHLETLIALLKGFQYTGEKACWNWFEKVHEYTWSHFHDAQYGEWFGYLNRRGEVLLNLKGGKWKGCYHVPRGLYQCWQILNSLE